MHMSGNKIEYVFFFSSRRRHTGWTGDWSSDVCSSDLRRALALRKDAGLLGASAPGLLFKAAITVQHPPAAKLHGNVSGANWNQTRTNKPEKQRRTSERWQVLYINRLKL